MGLINAGRAVLGIVLWILHIWYISLEGLCKVSGTSVMPRQCQIGKSCFIFGKENLDKRSVQRYIIKNYPGV